MHVFLTGLRGIGKTTVITRIVDGVLAGEIVSAGEIAGFRTVWMRHSRDMEADSDTKGTADCVTEALYIFPYKTEGHIDRPGSDSRYPPAMELNAKGAAPYVLLSQDPLSAVCEPTPVSARPVAERDMADRTLTIHPEVFDEDGVALLRAATEGATRPGLIIMDELGFMESDSHVFQQAVTDTLNGDIPVLGVMRWERNPFLNAVAAHEKVEVVEVNGSNRDTLPERLTERIFHG